MEDQQDLVGRVFSHFRVDARLGEGGMGVVYRAHDLQLDRSVALKFVSANADLRNADRGRLLREAQAAAKLNHPNICTVYAVGEEDGRCFIAMEYLAGSDVKGLLTGGALPWHQALSICLQAARALGEAHRHGIIHKDVKSGNIFVTEQGLVKLLDFGIARASLDPDATRTMQVQGTPYYMAPEQIEMLEVDTRCDLWSLGVVLYEMLTGSLPFGRNKTSVFRSILTETPAHPSTLVSTIPLAFDGILERALAKNVEERYRHAEEMIADLDQLNTSLEPTHPTLMFQARQVQTSAFDTFVDPRAIAVLPLINISPDPANEYICDGLAEELINGLTQMEGLRVVSRSSSFQCKGTTPDIREIGNRLRCSLLVHGSLRRSGDSLRLTVQLSDARGGYQIWSQRFDAQVRDLFALQDELTDAVLKKLEERLGSRLPARQTSRQVSNAEAYQLYLQARFAFHHETAASLRQALDLFLRASKADPGYAPALVGVAETSMRLDWYALESPTEALLRAKAALEGALLLDPWSVPSLYLLATIQAGYDWDWAAAEETFSKALEGGTGLTGVHFHYALDFLTPLGRLEEALAEILRALEMDPLSPIISTAVGGCYYRMRRWDEAARSLQETLKAHPGFGHAHWSLGRALLELGQFDVALAHVEEGAKIMGQTPGTQAELGYCYGRLGRQEDAERMLKELQRAADNQYVSPLHFAFVHVGLGQVDLAMARLEEAFRQRIRQLVWVKVDPRFDSLRGNASFARLISRLGLSD